MNFISELKRRNVIRMAGLYLVGAWLITQVAATLLPVFEAPTWVMKTIVGILAIGFIPAVIFSWIFELTPEGLKRDSEIPEAQSIAPQTARKMERMIIVLFAFALAFFAFDKFVLAPKREAALVAITSKAITENAAQQEKTKNEKSIAVLAFENRSADKENEYFSDGVAEEILNSLAKVKDLKVAGRSASFFFKGKNETPGNIGKTLGVAHVLEGSVRKQGNQLRITAQLIRVSDGFQLWSETFDGTDVDIFALQENIARAVTDQLQVMLQSDGKSQLVQIGTDNAEAYALYLRATVVLHKREYARMREAVGWLEQSIRLDPDFARAESRLALIYALWPPNLGGTPAQAEPHARRAIALDPTLAEPHYALGNWMREQRDFVGAREELDRALALDPGDASANMYLGQWLVAMGYTREGIAHLDKALAIDPMLPNALNWRAHMYIHAGDLDTASRMLDRADALGLAALTPSGRAQIARKRDDLDTAIALFEKWTLPLSPCVSNPHASAERVLRGIYESKPGGREQALAVVDECLAADPRPMPGWVPGVLLQLDKPARAFAAMESGLADNAGTMMRFWGETGVHAFDDPGFADFVRRFGLAAVWDKYGPPDRCKKNDKGDYVCE